MASSSINYPALIDEAMQNIVKQSLKIAEPNKLPGDHHFFISFITNFPGVVLSEKLRSKYLKEMTIVLQYQFENLTVNDTEFSVSLSFDDIRENIVIPFSALTAFADPSVQFGLQFKHVEDYFQTDKFQPTNKDSIEKIIENNESKKQTTSNIEKPIANNVISLDKFRKK